jgi:hypothetical protein
VQILTSFSALESWFTLIVPFKISILLNEGDQRVRMIGKTFYEPSVVTCQSKKGAHFMDVGWQLPVADSLNFARINCYTIFSDNVP